MITPTIPAMELSAEKSAVFENMTSYRFPAELVITYSYLWMWGGFDNTVVHFLVMVSLFLGEEVPDRLSDNLVPAKPYQFFKCLVAVVVNPPGIAIEDGCGGWCP